MSCPSPEPVLDLEPFREYLHFLARSLLSPALAGKVDLSGVVQQTMLEAFQAGDRFPREDPARQAAWLRRALANNLRDEVRKLVGRGAEPIRERSLEESSARLERFLLCEEPTPATIASRAERAVRLASGLARLPDMQRQAIELHHLGGLPLADVGAVLGRSREAIAGLVFRGLKRLRELLDGAGDADEHP